MAGDKLEGNEINLMTPKKIESRGLVINK